MQSTVYVKALDLTIVSALYGGTSPKLLLNQNAITRTRTESLYLQPPKIQDTMKTEIKTLCV